jgi:hypothetical protein
MADEAKPRKRKRKARSEPRLLWRVERVAYALDISRRVLERLRASGEFIEPDLFIGRMPLFSPARVHEWVRSRQEQRL